MSSVKTVAREEGVTGASLSVRSLLSLLRVVSVRQLFAEHEAHKSWRLQFRLRYFVEHASNDSGLQFPPDEAYVKAIGVDSAEVTVGPNHEPQVVLHESPIIGDMHEDSVRETWTTNPYVLFTFEPYREGDWPRTYTVTLLFVEKDNEDLADTFTKLTGGVGDAVKKAVSTAAAAGAGAAIGSVIPGIGTAVGAAIGALAGPLIDELFGAIRSGLANDVFAPRHVTLTVAHPAELRHHPDVDRGLSLRFQEQGADWELFYDWHLVG